MTGSGLSPHESGADADRFHNRMDNPYIRRKELQLARKVLTDIDGHATVLEIGCGEGSNLGYYQQLAPGLDCNGIDISIDKVRFMRRSVATASPVCATAQNLPFGDNCFDLVVMRDLLHHVEKSRETVLAGALRVLKPGGRIVILEANPLAPLNLVFMMLFPSERGMRHSTLTRLEALIAPAGRYRFTMVEASFLLRAIAFWCPYHPRSSPVSLLYRMAERAEHLLARCLPRKWWIYRMFTIEP